MHLSQYDRVIRYFGWLALTLPTSTFLFVPVAIAQISPATDGTGTTVTPNGNTFDIDGGILENNNLFHGFDSFNLDSGQTANFLSSPNIQNILGRVTGGDPSVIHGLLRITGSDANLFLMNPGGIVLGPDASLDVMGSFTATTATGIGFGDEFFWSEGSVDFSSLVGNPDSFRFDAMEPGAIANTADLTVQPGENISLIGGTVVNEGTLTAPGGNILLSAVEGENLAKITISGNLLSLEIQTLSDAQPTNITPSSLADLLTGGQISHATELQESGGVVMLMGSGVSVGEMGTVTNLGTAQAESIAIQGKKIVQGADLTATGGDILLDSENIELENDVTIATNGGNIEILGLMDGNKNLVLDAGTGEIFLQDNLGEQEPLGSFKIEAGNLTLLGNIEVATNNGNIEISGLVDGDRSLVLNAGTGDIFLQDKIGSMTPLGGIEIAAENVDLGVGTLETQNGDVAIAANNKINLTGDLEVTTNNGNIEILGLVDGDRSLAIDAGAGTILLQDKIGSMTPLREINIKGDRVDLGAEEIETDGGNVTIAANAIGLAEDTNVTANNGDIEISGAIDGPKMLVLKAMDGRIVLQDNIGSIMPLSNVEIWANEIELADNIKIETDNGNVKISGLVDGNHTLTIDTGEGNVTLENEIGSVTPLSGIEISAGNIDLQSDVRVENGAIALHASDGIVIQGLVASSGGDIDISATGGDVTINDSQAGAEISASPGGQITIESSNGSILGAADVLSEGDAGNPDGGAIALKAQGNIVIGAIAASAQSNGNAGKISVEAGESITAGSLNSDSDSGNGGAITFNAGGAIAVSGKITSRTNNGDGGDISS